MSTEPDTRYALIGINPETHTVVVTAAVTKHTPEQLRDMEGLLVVATSIDNARRLFGKRVPLADVARSFALGKYVDVAPFENVKRSGAG